LAAFISQIGKDNHSVNKHSYIILQLVLTRLQPSTDRQEEVGVSEHQDTRDSASGTALEAQILTSHIRVWRTQRVLIAVLGELDAIRLFSEQGESTG
jgi:hypothetical protein